jgi:hypothetical protein
MKSMRKDFPMLSIPLTIIIRGSRNTYSMECCKMISKETRCFSTKEDGDADVG